jgi:hypothetical protein
MVLTALALGLSAARAFPPAPDGLIYGMVKDQFGTPLMNPADTVVLQTPGGVQVATSIQPNLAIGVNYALDVPMDAGTIPNPYTANALTVSAQYKLYVSVGASTNTPIEMTGAYSLAGNPAFQVRQDLTLGTDTNGSGIPDQWIEVFLSEIGTNLPLASVNPNGVYTKSGRTLKQEYLLGNFPYNPADDFSVSIVNQSAGSAVLAFTTMTGRTYTAYGSADLQNWTPLSFTVPAAGAAVQSSYFASSIQPMQIQTVQPTNAPVMQFFRLQLQ